MTTAPRHGVPRVPSWAVPRARAAALPADAALVVVHGPAGAGKTLALAGWVREHVPADRAVVWLDASVAPSPDGLWERVLAALTDCGALPAPDDPPAPRPGTPTRGRDAADTAVASLQRLSAPVVLVVDGYEHVASAGTDDRLVQVLRHVDRLQVAVGTRRTPAHLLHVAALHLDTAALGPADLSLDDAEVGTLLAAAGQDPAAAARVREATDGLALAVRSLTVAAGRGVVDLVAAPTAELVRVAARGVVPALGTSTSPSTGSDDGPDDGYLTAARRLAVAEALPPGLARALAGEVADDVLDRLAADGLGTWQQDPTAFVLTPVVRAALRADLDRAEPAAVEGLLRSVVAWGLRSGRFYPALHAAAETGDLDLLTGTVLRIWGSGQVRDAAETIRVLESLPRAGVARRPQLSLLMALLYNTRAEHRARALEWFAISAGAAVYQLPRATVAERALLRAGESVAARLLGRGGRARAAALAALEHLTAVAPGDDPAVDVLRGLLHRQLGVGIAAGGDVEHALRVIEGALPHDPSGSLATFSTYSLLAGLTAAQGDLAATRRLVAVASELEPPRRPETAYRRSTLDLARVHLAVEDGDLDRATALLDAMAGELRTNEFWPAFAEVQATVDLLRGRVVAGEEALDQRMRRGRRSPTSSAWRARLVAARGLLALAGGQAERGLALLAPVPSSRPAARVARARLLMSTGRRTEALALLAAPDLPDEGARLRVTRRLLLAAASAAEGQEAVAGRALREAAAVVAVGGSAVGWVLLAPEERAAVRRLADGLADPAVDRCLTALADVPAPVPDAQAGVGLSEREVVVLRELADDAELADVAARLQVSHNTVKTQVRSTYRKLGVRRRADAVARARELGLL
jgi:LuxR family maltose regulon positive regulatory protein